MMMIHDDYDDDDDDDDDGLLTFKNLSYYFRYTKTVEIPQVRTNRYGTRSFRSTAAKMWNNLPQHFRDY